MYTRGKVAQFCHICRQHMFFYLSKLLLFVLKPLLWIIAMSIWALLSKNDRLKKRLSILSLVTLLLCSNPFLAYQTAGLLEKPERNRLDSHYQIGLVLGGFAKWDTSLNRTVFFEANDRLMQALKCYHTGLIDKIMISSGSASLIHQKAKEADAIKTYLMSLNIPDSNILIENQSKNTFENIVFSKEIFRQKKLISKPLIFTSAWHIPRVKMCSDVFLKSDFYPCHYLHNPKQSFDLYELIVPSAKAIDTFEICLKEWIGQLAYWAKLKWA